MSFMFHPYPYKDLHAVNPVTPRDTVVEGALPVARRIAALFAEGCRSVGLDGYAGTEFDVLYQLLAAQLLPQGVRIVRTEELLLPPETIREMLRDSLPEDRSLDPVLLYAGTRISSARRLWRRSGRPCKGKKSCWCWAGAPCEKPCAGHMTPASGWTSLPAPRR